MRQDGHIPLPIILLFPVLVSAFSGLAGRNLPPRCAGNSAQTEESVLQGLNSLRKTSNSERRPYPQRLKPDIITITYGRPEGRPLQRI